MSLIDTHCHLTHELFKKDVDKVIQRAKDANFKAILVSGVNPPTNRDTLKLIKKDPILKASLGIYPLDAIGLTPDTTGMQRHPGNIDINAEFEFFNKHKDEITSIGEVGLDYKFTKEHNDQQKANFQKIINYTEKLKKPIVVHTRKAEADCIELLESSNLKHVLLHTFEGNKKLIKKAIDLGYYFSVPTLIMRLQHFQMLVDMAPIEQIFTETDAPWLAPNKEDRNEPSFIVESIKKIAEIKKTTTKETENQIWKNYKNVFGVD
jgi:TatD DNase family protein